jgi:phage shock protein A
MFKLTDEQKLANYEELLAQKRQKVQNLQKELEALEKKILKFRAKNQKAPQ